MEHFGEHLMLDGYQGAEELLDDESIMRTILEDLPTMLVMRTLSDPEVYRAKGNDIKDPGGWTGFVVIEESHISVHTFAKRGFVSADVYTCRNGLDVKLIENYFKEKYELQDLEVRFVKRGTRYPESNIY